MHCFVFELMHLNVFIENLKVNISILTRKLVETKSYVYLLCFLNNT